MKKKLYSLTKNGLISSPQLQNFPIGFPFHAAVCAIDLPTGCLRPISGAARRIATGYSFKVEEAEMKALAEASERYSLQYSSARPQQLDSFESSAGDVKRLEIDRLTLGAPNSKGIVDSKGCAAGSSITDASYRAVLELIEHHRSRRMHLGEIKCDALTQVSHNISLLRDWLAAQFRVLHLANYIKSGIVTTISCCCDNDGGRPTYGSAAGTSIEEVSEHASFEAIFHWRNMIEIERNATLFPMQRDEEQSAFLEYRGAELRRKWPVTNSGYKIKLVDQKIELFELMTALSSETCMKVYLFDMTIQGVDVPVVRAQCLR